MALKQLFRHWVDKVCSATSSDKRGGNCISPNFEWYLKEKIAKIKTSHLWKQTALSKGMGNRILSEEHSFNPADLLAIINININDGCNKSGQQFCGHNFHPQSAT